MNSTDLMIDFAAGGISAAVSKTVVAPLERVKILLQIQVCHSVLVVLLMKLQDNDQQSSRSTRVQSSCASLHIQVMYVSFRL